jgi:Xaa-Pro aminopeptidase
MSAIEVPRARLIDVDWPAFGSAERPPPVEASELQARLDALRSGMAAAKLTHAVVYGDREHFANLAYLTHFDPRFEEALLVVTSKASSPLLLVGNECEGYVGISPLLAAGRLRFERYQPFSLLNQPRNASRALRDILASEGIGSGARVGCVGWKYFAADEHPDAAHAIDLPAYMVDNLRELAGREAVVNATSLLMHPASGLRSRCSAAEIAFFEYTGVLAGEGMKRMLFGLKPGMLDTELAALSGYNGEPLSCYMTMVTEANRNLGLSGPVGARIARG